MGKQTPQSVTNPPAQQAEQYARRRAAAKDRRAGMTWDEIAERHGYATRSSAFDAVKALMKEERALALDEVSLLRAESLARYMDLLAAQWPYAMDGDTKAAAECRLILTRMDKLNGTEAEAVIRHEFGESDIDRALRDLEAELNRRAADDAGQAAGGQAPSA